MTHFHQGRRNANLLNGFYRLCQNETSSNNEMNSRADRFEWSGGHPALDFVNTLDERPSDEPIENLATYRDLARFSELAGLVEPPIARPLQRLHDPASFRIVKRARRL